MPGNASHAKKMLRVNCLILFIGVQRIFAKVFLPASLYGDKDHRTRKGIIEQ
jgi:hypothetical protein